MNLSKRQTKALKASIRHWYRVRDTEEEVGSVNCDLCRKYVAADCRSCPVFLYAGHAKCIATPYQAYADYLFDTRRGLRPFSEPRLRDLAQKEINFLVSLLPKGVEPPEDPQKKGIEG